MKSRTPVGESTYIIAPDVCKSAFSPGKFSFTIIQVQTVGFLFQSKYRIRVAISIHIEENHIQRMRSAVNGHMGGRNIFKPCRFIFLCLYG